MRSMSRVMNTQSRAQDELTTREEQRQQAPDVPIATCTRHTALDNINCSSPVGLGQNLAQFTLCQPKTTHSRTWLDMNLTSLNKA